MARVAAGVGYKPQRPISEQSPITYDGSTGDLNPEGSIADIAAAIVTFGTGAPGGVPEFDGQLYFDDTGPYAGYVGRAGAWHAF